jgi:chromosomal replication initiation ATPase DnaA
MKLETHPQRSEQMNRRHGMPRIQDFFAQIQPPASTADLRALALQMIELAVEIDIEELAEMNKCDPIDILHTVSDLCRVPLEDLRGSRGNQHVATARQLAMYLCRELSKLSFPAVGRVFGRDHSTVIHGYRLIARRRLASEPFDRMVRDLIAKLDSTDHNAVHAA